MNYCKIDHKEKIVSFKSGKTGKEFYIHIKSTNLMREFGPYFEVLKREELNQDLDMRFGEINWKTLVGSWKNFDLEDLCEDMKEELVREFEGNFGKWSGCIRPDGIYLNFRIYKYDKEEEKTEEKEKENKIKEKTETNYEIDYNIFDRAIKSVYEDFGHGEEWNHANDTLYSTFISYEKKIEIAKDMINKTYYIKKEV